MIAVICICIGFNSSASITAAYGLGVSLDLFVKTALMSATIIVVHKIHWIIAIAFFVPSGALEMSLLVANYKEAPHGAWFTLMITFAMLAFILLWH